MRRLSLLLWIVLLAVAPCGAAHADVPLRPGTPLHGIPGVEDRHLQADFWIALQQQADAVLVEPQRIAQRNRSLFEHDPAVYDLRALPGKPSRRQVLARIRAASVLPSAALYRGDGMPLDPAARAALLDALATDTVPAQARARPALVTSRADMRTFPTTLRVFRSAGDTDIDRFQETALFPGTPLLLLHRSRDSEWWFAISPLYAGWVHRRHVAEGSAAQVFGYTGRKPFLVVTGASARTVFNPMEPQLSQLQLDMGVRVPLLADWPADRPVHGQHPYTAHVIELPVRGSDGGLRFEPALLPRSADVAARYLPLTPANLLRQAFKFLGERYGWGHSYNARDCSGFVSEVYRSFGVVLPRNTSAQAVTEVLDRVELGPRDTRARRLALLRTLDAGDLVYIPGHVMMVIGQYAGGPYVIHDTTGISYPGADGSMRRVALNQVAVTPLLPLHVDADTSYVERITSIQRIRPADAAANPPRLRRQPSAGAAR